MDSYVCFIAFIGLQLVFCCVSLFQISHRVWGLVQSGVRAERVYRPVYSAEVRTWLRQQTIHHFCTTVFPECLSLFLWAMLTSENCSAATVFLKQSQKLEHHLTTSPPPLSTLFLVCVCVYQQVWGVSVVSLNICGTLSSVHTKRLNIADQYWRKLSYLYKWILFILFILKNNSVYLVLLLFVSI